MIRKIKYSDFEYILELSKKIFSVSEIYSLEFLYKTFGYCFLDKNGKIIGYIICIEKKDNDILITSLGIEEKFRKRGIGKVLLKICIETLKEKGNIYLHVRSKNVIAINLYKKNGFKEIEKISNYYEDDSAIYMELKK